MTLDVDRTVTATFGAQPPPPAGTHRLNVVVQGRGHVVSAPPGIDCGTGGSCSTTIPDGTGVTLTANGGTFVRWDGACTGTSTCSFVLSGDAIVSAFFTQPPPPPTKVTLTVAVTGPGTVTGSGISCGGGANTCSATVDSGTTVSLSAAPSPHVRFMGWGGACSGSANPCPVKVISDTTVRGTFEDEVRVIAGSGNDERVLALNSTQVFFVRFSSDGQQIWSAPKAGGDATKLVDLPASYMVANDQYLYWTNGSVLFSMPASGGAVSPIANHLGIGRLALDADGALYYVAGYYSPTQTVYRMQSRIETALASGQGLTLALAVDASSVWFAAKNATGIIYSVPKAGGLTTQQLDCHGCEPVVLRLDSTTFYYRNPNGETFAHSKSGSASILLTTPLGNGAYHYYYGIELEVNASTAWWNWITDFGNSGNGLYHVNADGSGFAGSDSAGDYEWGALRVDDTAAYYFHAGLLIKRLK